MMNLLPTDMKTEIRAARTNVILVRYIGILLIALLVIGGVIYGTFVLLQFTNQSAKSLIEANDVQAGVYSQTKSQVDTLSASLASAKTILNDEVLYSKVLIDIAQLMPPGTVIDKIALNKASFNGTPIALTVYATTTETAVQLQEKFRSSTLFSSINFQTMDVSGGVAGYPVSVSMTAALNRGGLQ